MTVLSKFSSVAGARSLDAASTSTLGCTGPTMIRPNHPDLGGRRDPVRSTRPVASAAGSDKLHKRRKTQVDEEFRYGSMNVGTMKGKCHEVVETADRRNLDAVGLQETRWRGGESPTRSRTQVRWLKGKDSRYKFFWSGNSEGTNGVGILLAERWAKSVFEVQRISDRIILLRLIIGGTVFTLISVYAPQQGRPAAEKDRFYDQLHAVAAKIPLSEVLIPLGDWNGHVGATADGYEGVHGGFGYGARNPEGERILDFGVAHNMVVGNTLFKKRDSHLITYVSGDHKTQVDYVLFRSGLRKLLKDVKVIPNEECLPQHRLLVCTFKISIPPKPKRKFTARLRTWKLRDPVIEADFKTEFETKCREGAPVDAQTQSTEEIWERLKSNLNSAAESACGQTRGHQWKRETWFWNDKVDEAIKAKRACFKVYNNLRKLGLFDMEFWAAKNSYKEAKKNAKRVVWVHKQIASRAKFADVDLKGPEIHRMAKQMRRDNQDVCGEMPVRNNEGVLCLGEEERMKAWVEHYKSLLNVEFPWDESALPEAPPVAGPPPSISEEKVIKALGKMKSGKAGGPSGIIVEMLKAAGQTGITFLRELITSVMIHGKIPEDWEMSFILNLYKGKGDALNRGNYRGLKLTEHVMKVMERIVDEMIRELISIDEMQFAFVPGRGTTDAIFIIRQLQEKFLSMRNLDGKNLTLYFAFVDLEKAFDRVPRKVLWWAMRSLGVDEWIVRLVQAMYSNARSRVRVGDSYSEEFDVTVGVHQGSVLSPLLFIIVLEALSRDFRVGVPWELFFADDLVIIATSIEECVARVEAWKKGMESKGLRVNMGKTKVMASGVDLDVLQDSGKFPCAVCRTGVGASSMLCVGCKHWVHKKCSGLKTLVKDPTYQCPRCRGDPSVRPIDGRPFKVVQVGECELDNVDRFCYLGDMLSAGGGCMAAATARCRSAWGKFHEHVPLLTARALPLKVRGRLLSSNVRSSMLHATETWPMSSEARHKLCRNDRAMIRWICGVKPLDEPDMEVLHKKLGLEDLATLIRRRRLRWFGHVERSSGEINRVRSMSIDGRRGLGRPRKTWSECVKEDLAAFKLKPCDAQDRAGWRSSVKNSKLEPTPQCGSASLSAAVRPTRGVRTRSSINNKTGFD